MTAFAYPLTGLVTILSVLVFFWMMLQVGKARRTHSVSAPIMTGPGAFNRVVRVHENTLEGLAMFLPALWLVALTTQDLWAAIIGIFFPVARILYARGYYVSADKRGPGFLISFLCTALLLLVALVMLARIAFNTYA
jgi:glutathione S-transferase